MHKDIFIYEFFAPCNKHEHCIKIIEESYKTNTELICELLIIKNNL